MTYKGSTAVRLAATGDDVVDFTLRTRYRSTRARLEAWRSSPSRSWPPIMASAVGRLSPHHRESNARWFGDKRWLSVGCGSLTRLNTRDAWATPVDHALARRSPLSRISHAVYRIISGSNASTRWPVGSAGTLDGGPHGHCARFATTDAFGPCHPGY